MLIAGAVLVVLAVVCLAFAHRSRARLHAMIAAETIPISELEEHRRTLADLGSAGGFRKVCEVVGVAAPAPHGPLYSEQTGTECVWYRQSVTRRYRTVEHDSDGDWRTVERTETVVDRSSPQGWAVVDETGTIGLDPAGTAPDRPELVGRRFEPGGGGFGGLSFGGFDGMVTVGGGDTIGFEYREWVIRPGHRLYVLGEVHDRVGPLVIGKPESGTDPFVVSTRTEAQLRAERGRRQLVWAWSGAAAGALGVVLAVLGLVS